MRFVTEIWHPNIDQNGDGKSYLLIYLGEMLSGSDSSGTPAI